MASEILEIQDLTKKFSPSCSLKRVFSTLFYPLTPVVVLDQISVSLQKGKILGILGPNGAGKTTLLKIIATLILPDNGSVKVANYHTEKDDKKIRALVGLVYGDERNFYWRLTGRQNLEFFATLYNLSEKKAKERINYLLNLFDINYADKRFDIYSTGMKRKFNLIRALLSDPQLLLLDEPTKSLDYRSKKELHSFIQDHIKEKTTAVLATHNFEEAQSLCDEFLILNKGLACAHGTLDEIKTQTKTNNLENAYLALTQHNE